MREENEIRREILYLHRVSGEAFDVLSSPRKCRYLDFVDLEGLRRTRQRTLATAAALDWVLEVQGVEPPSAR